MPLPFQEHIDAGVEILKESWRDYFSKFWSVAALCSVLMGPPLVADAVASSLFKGKGAIACGALTGLWTLAAFTLLLASLLRLFEFSSKGESPSLLKCLSPGWRPYFKLFSVCFAFAIILVALVIAWFAAFGFLSAGRQGGTVFFAITSFLAVILAWLCLLVRVSLVFPICLFEGWDFGRLLARGYVQMSGNYLLMLAVYAAGLFLALAASIALAVAAMLALTPATSHAWRLIDDPAFHTALKLLDDVFFCFLAAILYRSYKRLCEG